MISSITIRNVATYRDEEARVEPLGKQCLFFGDNGSGKTTISRIIAKPENFPLCSVDAPEDTLCLVYNSDFVEKAYRESSYPGVFTLGEREREVEEQIERLTAEQAEIRKRDGRLAQYISETNDEEREAHDKLASTVWEARKRLPSSLQKAFKGYQTNKEKLLKQLLELEPAAEVPAEGNLIEEADVLFQTAPERQELLRPLDSATLSSIESADEWSRPLVGSGDVPLAALITQLESSDWVRRGLGLLHDDRCPFCQQPTPDGLKEDLERVFDHAYEDGIRRLQQLRDDYTRESRAVEAALDGIQEALSQSVGLDLGKLRAALAANRTAMERKLDAPSTPAGVESTALLLHQVDAALEAENASIRERNTKLDNHAAEAQRLTKSVWQLLLSRVSASVTEYKQRRSARRSKLNSLEGKRRAQLERLTEVDRELRELHSSLATVEGTVAKINALLERFGFNGFRLEVSPDRRHYVVVRTTGEPVERTLSEGEKTLVSFLYFYHLAQGGREESEAARKRVIVVDDPISSLDANVLFLVSTLVREMLGWAQTEQHRVQQVIVLTHNAYFHKEVSFKEGNGLIGRLQHWSVRKLHGTSRVERCSVNPVRSSYSLLWNTVRMARDGTGADHHALANAMRRILENYFCFLGGTWDARLRKYFSGEDLMVFSALISWVHDGSHRIFDGLEISPGHSNAQYLSVFEQIFRQSGHDAHFDMMMGSDGS